MKEGTGDDPFADTAVDGDADTDDDANTPLAADQEGAAAEEAPDDSTTPSTGEADAGMPYAVRRSSVKSGREMVQFYLKDSTLDRESEFQRSVEDETGYDVYTTDLREAAYLVAMRHPDEVAAVLDKWGCEYD